MHLAFLVLCWNCVFDHSHARRVAGSVSRKICNSECSRAMLERINCSRSMEVQRMHGQISHGNELQFGFLLEPIIVIVFRLIDSI